jgi:hypothetical protein
MEVAGHVERRNASISPITTASIFRSTDATRSALGVSNGQRPGMEIMGHVERRGTTTSSATAVTATAVSTVSTVSTRQNQLIRDAEVPRHDKPGIAALSTISSISERDVPSATTPTTTPTGLEIHIVKVFAAAHSIGSVTTFAAGATAIAIGRTSITCRTFRFSAGVTSFILSRYSSRCFFRASQNSLGTPVSVSTRLTSLVTHIGTTATATTTTTTTITSASTAIAPLTGVGVVA